MFHFLRSFIVSIIITSPVTLSLLEQSMFGGRKGRRLYFLRVFNEGEIPGWRAGDKRSHWSGNSGVVQGCKPKCLLWGRGGGGV